MNEVKVNEEAEKNSVFYLPTGRGRKLMGNHVQIVVSKLTNMGTNIWCKHCTYKYHEFYYWNFVSIDDLLM